jgi:DNA-binding NarL/FixJ family response regulator
MSDVGVGAFLVVEPDVDTRALLSALCRTTRRTQAVGSVAQATKVLAASVRWTGFIFEINLPDGSGIDLLAQARAKYPLVPALILTASTDPGAINDAHALRAEFHCKPTRRSRLRGFIRRTIAFERVGDLRISWLIEDAVRAYKLSPRETDLLSAAVAGTPRKTLADELGTTENTLKTQVRTLLRKCAHQSLEDLGRHILRQALDGSSPDDEEGPRSVIPDSAHPPSIRAP